jgi:hypothetical protein
MERGEEAYQQNRAEWEQEYDGQFIAIHRDRVVAADENEHQLVRQVIELQRRRGRFTAYIVKVGAPVIAAHGPHGRPRMRVPRGRRD